MEKRVKKENCTLIYEVQDNCTKIKRSVPDDGVCVFEIQNTYAKNVPVSKYYLYGTTANEVKKRFMNCFPWINTVKSVKKITDKNELEEILTNPMRMPI